jgi:hypothetical protein
MSFDTLKYDSSAQNYDSKFTLTKGRMSALVETAKNQTFRVQTPVSICGVRGTFMDVTVSPVMQAGGGQSPENQTARTFFEGGNGYVTSTASGQTQEVGAGQNVLVDQGGAISELMMTTNEERNNLVEGWTLTQSMGTMSGAEPVATNLSEGTQTGALPPGQTEPQDQSDLTQGANDTLNNMDVISTVTFDQVNPIEQPVVEPVVEPPAEEPIVPLEPPGPDPYINSLAVVTGEGSDFAGGNLDLVVSNAGDNTWSGTINATYNWTVWSPWEISFYDEATGDYVTIGNLVSDGVEGEMSVGGEGVWAAGEGGATTDAVVDIQEVTGKNLTVTEITDAAYSGDGETGTITGTVSGTWEEAPLPN